ncbi:DUF29 family protein [Pleurocapsa sp. FMAR1]|uniref:DUF29 family protein n=1 Tax=Pleurocapsa sp. FMAR1 TaxID=3040204 RepID=UPI0029C6845B|nr:DUF29 family protein [Pleurocapsa sp. FMAR1]
MEELTELRNNIITGKYSDALTIIDELEEISRRDVIRKIESYLVRLIAHLIKNQLEEKLTNSWIASIRDSIRQIRKLNLMSKNSYYIKKQDWQQYLEEALEAAIDDAAIEVFGGTLKPSTVSARVNQEQISAIVLDLLELTYDVSGKQLSEKVNTLLQKLPGGEKL